MTEETWIKTTDRLPELRQKVLVFTPADGEIRVGWREPDDYRGIVQWRCLKVRSPLYLTYHVSHWMELPAAPRRSER